MKKLFAVLAAITLAVSLSACKPKEEKGNFDVANGTYFAATEGFDHGFRYWVTVTVDNGKITDATWNAFNIDGGAGSCEGDDKYICSELGNYGMNGNKGAWYEQVDKITKWLVDNQDTELDFTDGVADSITTVSITTKGFFDLVNSALENDPVPAGNYKDGYYYFATDSEPKTVKNHAVKYDAEGNETDDVLADVEETFQSYTFGTFVVVNGTIVIADFNATQIAYDYKVDENGAFVTDEDGLKYIIYTDQDVWGQTKTLPQHTYLTKDTAKEMYGMSKAGSKLEWFEQVQLIEDKVLTDQALESLTDSDSDGKCDQITSVSITHSLGSFIEVFTKLPTK